MKYAHTKHTCINPLSNDINTWFTYQTALYELLAHELSQYLHEKYVYELLSPT